MKWNAKMILHSTKQSQPEVQSHLISSTRSLDCRCKSSRPAETFHWIRNEDWPWLPVRPNAILAALTVFERSMAMVIGPTPPGTGVIAEATMAASSKQTSPITRNPDSIAGSCTVRWFYFHQSVSPKPQGIASLTRTPTKAYTKSLKNNNKALSHFSLSFSDGTFIFLWTVVVPFLCNEVWGYEAYYYSLKCSDAQYRKHTSIALVPTSMTTAPGFTQLPRTSWGTPVAEIKMSAFFVASIGLGVSSCRTVTSAFRFCRTSRTNLSALSPVSSLWRHSKTPRSLQRPSPLL